MTAHVISLEEYLGKRKPSNPCREAMVKSLTAVFPYETEVAGELTDDVLANLWFLGFRIVPVGEDE